MYPAEFGGKASALINVVSKAGSNTFHGSGLEFLRDDAFDARNYFDDPAQPVPPLRQHQFGAYLYRLQFRPVNPQAARGSFTFNGQWTGNAFADFLLGYPSAAQVGIGRADEDGRTAWFHTYVQDDWRIRPNLTINAGLRYEINSQMTDVDNRLSAVDLSVPGGRFVIASDDQGHISPAAQPLLSQIPIAYVTSSDAGWTPGLLRPSYLRALRGWAWPGRWDRMRAPW